MDPDQLPLKSYITTLVTTLITVSDDVKKAKETTSMYHDKPIQPKHSKHFFYVKVL